MQGAATQAMPLCIVEERQRRRWPPAAAALRAFAKCRRYSLTGPYCEGDASLRSSEPGRAKTRGLQPAQPGLPAHLLLIRGDGL
ncbi:MAG: hypothetical protein H6Q05_5022 [Acidobacteria bacterium]|nr:hypothetical protein [Acidobacteriota bacterium]